MIYISIEGIIRLPWILPTNWYITSWDWSDTMNEKKKGKKYRYSILFIFQCNWKIESTRNVKSKAYDIHWKSKPYKGMKAYREKETSHDEVPYVWFSFCSLKSIVFMCPSLLAVCNDASNVRREKCDIHNLKYCMFFVQIKKLIFFFLLYKVFTHRSEINNLHLGIDHPFISRISIFTYIPGWDFFFVRWW